MIDAKNGIMKIVVNGVEVASGDFGKDIHVSKLPLRIGWIHDEGDPQNQEFSPFAGQIDEVRIWNTARTEAEIKHTMHLTLSGEELGLVGYWRFDNVSKMVTDSSSYGNDGKLLGDAHYIESELPKPGELLIPTVISGQIMDEHGQPIPNASVRLEKDSSEIEQTDTNASGNYRIVIPQKPIGLCDLSATSGTKGNWQLNIRLREGEHRKVDLTLKEAINIEGTLLMLDDNPPMWWSRFKRRWMVR